MNLMNILPFGVAALLFGFLGACRQQTTTTEKKIKENQAPNVLFIIVDDLKPKLGCYGERSIQSPHIDQLASQAHLFERAYCNFPVCGASRSSLLSGLRPTRDRFLFYYSSVEEDAPGTTSLPMHFKNKGYYTLSYGKVYHDKADQEESWSEAPYRPESKVSWRDYITEKNLQLERQYKKSRERGREQEARRGFFYECVDTNDQAYYDGKLTQDALNKLKELKTKKQPFFFSVGYLKPHLPFNAPKKYYDKYPIDSIELPKNYHRNSSMPDGLLHTFGELRQYSGIPSVDSALVLDTALAKKLIQGYKACVSYTDAHIGRLLDGLEAMGLSDNTMVVLIGDHGWFLGQHALWCKHTNLLDALHVPMIIREPGQSEGKRWRKMVEFVDLYPTLCDMAGLSQPEHLQGNSFYPFEESKEENAIAYCRYFNQESVILQDTIYTEVFKSNEGEQLLGRVAFDWQRDSLEQNNLIQSQDSSGLLLHQRALNQHRKQVYK